MPAITVTRVPLRGASGSSLRRNGGGAIRVTEVPLRETTSYEAPSLRNRVRMTRNGLGVQMLANVNGEGAYEANGRRKQRRKARKHARRAKSWSRAAKRSRSRSSRRYAYKQAKRYGKKSRKRWRKYNDKTAMKRMAHSVGLKRKELEAILRAKGATKAEAKAEAKAATSGGGGGGGGAAYQSASEARDGNVYGDDFQFYSPNGRRRGRRSDSVSRSRSNRKAARRWSGSEGNMARRKGRKSRRSARRGRRSNRRGYGRARKTRRSRKSYRRSRGRSRRKSRGRGRRRSKRGSRRRFRRNGEGAFEMNGRRRWRGKKSWRRRGGYNKRGGVSKKFLKSLGLDAEEYGNPLQAMLADELIAKHSGDPDKLQKALKRLASATNPSQYRKGRFKIPVEVVVDPITGKKKRIDVPYYGKARVAYGPYRRKVRKGRLTYEYKKGKHIPTWALVGAPSKKFFESHRDLYASQLSMLEAARREGAGRVEARSQKAQEKLLKRFWATAAGEDGGDMYTPNRRRGRKSRRGRGRRRFSARARRASMRNLRKAWASNRRRGRKGRKGRKYGRRRSKRRGRKSYRRNGRKRGRSRRRGRGRRGSKRRSRGRRRGRKGGRRRGRKRGRRRSKRGRGRARRRGRGRRRFRRNAAEDILSSVKEGFSIGLPVAGGLAVSRLAGGFLEQLAPVQGVFGASGPLGTFGRPALLALVAAVGIPAAIAMLPGMIGHEKAMLVAAGLGGSVIASVFGTFVPSSGLAGSIGWENTSGWGRKFPMGAYELRGLGAYETRGNQARPVQALAGYTQAMAGAPRQAMAGYTQAMAAYELRGLGDATYDGVQPHQADAALTEAEALADVEGEYVPRGWRPEQPLFYQDPLAQLGVPGDMGGGVAARSIWLPGQDIDETTTVGGLFDDPNSLQGMN